MTRPSRANEIPELVRRLGSRRRSTVDAARARLAIIGGRAVERLIEALEGDNNRIRTHAMPLLALIRDPRGREPLIAMLLDRDPRMREIAVLCLARFPSREAVAALERLLDREERSEPRIAAVHSLVEQYAAGQEPAIRRVLEILFDAGISAEVRSAALSLLPLLKAAQRRSVLKTLRRDPDTEIVEKAGQLEEQGGARSKVEQAVETDLADLAAEDYAAWNGAVHRLAARGAAVVRPMVEQMRGRSHDPEYCARAGMVLKALGPRRGRTLAEEIERVDEPLPLQVLVEVIGSLGEKAMIYRLKGLIERLRSLPGGAAQVNGFDMMQRVRAKAHLELARIGSRVAVEDLRGAVGDPERRIELELLAALELIGKRDEILDLLRAHRREDRFVRERIAAVVRAIMKRERIRRNDPMFQALGAELRRTFDAIHPPLEPRSRRPAKRRPRAARGPTL